MLLLQYGEQRFFCYSYRVYYFGCSDCYDKVLLLWWLQKRKTTENFTADITNKDPFVVVKDVGIYHFILLFPMSLFSFPNTIPRYSIPSTRFKCYFFYNRFEINANN